MSRRPRRRTRRTTKPRDVRQRQASTKRARGENENLGTTTRRKPKRLATVRAALRDGKGAVRVFRGHLFERVTGQRVLLVVLPRTVGHGVLGGRACCRGCFQSPPSPFTDAVAARPGAVLAPETENHRRRRGGDRRNRHARRRTGCDGRLRHAAFVGYGAWTPAAGVGYGLSVQISTAAPFGEGLSVGLVTSARAAGAFLFVPVVRYLLDVADVGGAMATMGALRLAAAAPAALTLSGRAGRASGGRRGRGERRAERRGTESRRASPAMVTLWATLGLGVSAGLMVISHAATLLYSHGVLHRASPRRA